MSSPQADDSKNDSEPEDSSPAQPQSDDKPAPEVEAEAPANVEAPSKPSPEQPADDLSARIESAIENAANAAGEPEDSQDESAGPELDPKQESLNQAIGASFQLLRLIMMLLFVLLVAECVRYVDAGTVAVKLRFGEFVRDDQGRVVLYTPQSRFVVVLPEPLETLHTVSLRTETLNLTQEFWPKVDKVESLTKNTVLPPQKSMDPNIDGYNLTGDFNIVHSQWQVEYKVSDPVRYLSSVALLDGERLKDGMERVLGRLAASVITRNMAGANVDQVLTGDLSARILSELRALLSEACDGQGFGLEVTAVNNRRLRPPGVSQGAFNRVAGALNEKNKLESEAQAYAGRLTSQADAEAKKIELVAQVTRRRLEEQAKADAASLKELLGRFPDNPRGLRIYLLQRRQDWLREILESSKLYILPKNDKTTLRIGPAPEEAALDRKTGGGK